MVSPDLAASIRSGVRKLNTLKKDIIIKNTIAVKGEKKASIDVKLHKPNTENQLLNTYIVELLNEQEVTDDFIEISNETDRSISQHRFDELENELNIAKTELQNVVEELETSNEELQSSNEELMASNEELQSTNEELQSVNEELYTVNTELQEKNKELVYLNNDINNLLNSTDIATLFLDTQLNIRKFTPAIQEHFNLSKEDVNRPISSFASNFDQATRNIIIDNAKSALKRLKNVEKEIQNPEGKTYLCKITPFITQDNNIDGVILSFVDLTTLKNTQKELTYTALKYKRLFENLNEGFTHCEIITNEFGKPVNWKYIDVNPAFEKHTGLNRKDVVGKLATTVFKGIENDSANWLERYGETALTGKDQFIEDFSETMGRYYIIHVFSPKKGEFATTFADISDYKMKEAALKKRESELKRVQEITHVGSWYLDIATNEVEWTQELYDMYGFDSSLPPPPYSEHKKLFTPDSWELLSTSLQNAIDNEVPYELELRTVRADGGNGWMWVIGEPVYDHKGKMFALRGAAQDVTDRKNLELALRKAKQEAESANLLKNNFLANMSHEIRTPMNSIIGFASLLKDEDTSQEDREQFVEIIDSNSKQLLRLIDDIIDVAKIESNELKINTSKVNLSKIIRELEVDYNRRAQNELKTSLIYKSTLPKNQEDVVILTDGVRLRQIITNLLGNALKFTEKGVISFGFKVLKNKIIFSIKDQGVGIEKEELERIFGRFKQVYNQDNAKYGGTGLGLTISKGLVELLGGDISISSKVGIGTEFTFSIPYVSIDQTDKKKHKILPISERIKGKTILIAEDNNQIQQFLENLFKDSKVNLVFANNGNQAIQKFLDHNVDLVLMDLSMPEKTGYDAAKEILNIDKKATIIAQTAFANNDAKERCEAIGFKDFILKPIQKDKLFNTIAKFV